MTIPVIPAKAGIQEKQAVLDPGFDDFLRVHLLLGISRFSHFLRNLNKPNPVFFTYSICMIAYVVLLHFI
jgi:hypothetical protein